jgi:hypothetical protein
VETACIPGFSSWAATGTRTLRRAGMDPNEALAILRKASRRTARSMLIVGVPTVGLGAFMIALHAVGLDPDAQSMGTGMLAALYGLGALFIVSGLLMTYVGLFVSAAQSRTLLDALVHRPHEITTVTHRRIQTAGAPGDLGAVHQLVFEVGNKARRLTVERRDLDVVLPYLAVQVPHALVDHDLP